MSKPKPIKFTRTEGGQWELWVKYCDRDFSRPSDYVPHVHSVLFEDGSIFDTVSGWRPQICTHCWGSGLAVAAAL